MKISPAYTDTEYSQLNFENEADWQRAIDMLENRIKGRFLDPIKKIEKGEYSGFAVLALDCLLIETLQQFRKGVYETPYGENRDYFTDFLTETSFNQYFDLKSARKFYVHIRNGILHQAETKYGTTIRITSSLPLVSENGSDLIINRKKFHQELCNVFNAYLSELREGNDPDLRMNFKNKMDYICRIRR